MPESTEVLPELPRAVPGEYLVKFRNSDRVRALSALGETSFRPLRTFRNQPDLYLVRHTDGPDNQFAAAALAQRGDVEYVEPNFYVHENVIPNDPRFGDQWGLLSPASFGGIPGADMNATAAWNFTTGSAGVVVAVLDSGVDYLHEDLAANIYSSPLDCNGDGVDNDNNGYIDDCHGIDVVDHDSNPMDPRGHGTHVAGILGAVGNNGIGVAGVAWQVGILPCRFLDASGQGTTAGAIECLDYVATLRQAGVNIVATNNSWGQYYASRALDDAIRRQLQAGILLVASAGNVRVDVDQQPQYPCSSDVLNLICVAGSALDDLNFFNWGRRTVLVQAPGHSIWSTYPGNQYTALDGTSMAAPHVSGVIALLAAQGPSRDWRALRNLVAAGAEPHIGQSPQTNAPHLDAYGSLTCANRTAIKRLKPAAFEVLRRPVGAQIVVSVLHVNCASPAGLVAVNIDQTGTVFLLSDDGTGLDEVAGDGIYTGTWTVPAVGDYTLSVQGIPGDPINVKGEAELKPGFPASMYVDPDRSGWIGGFGHAIIVGNVAGDAKPEILAPGLLQGPLYGIDHTGISLPGWPSFESFRASMPSLGELDGEDSVKEIVADFRLGGLRRLSATGITLPDWRKDGAAWSPVLADLDGDGKDELISSTTFYADGTAFSSAAGIPATAGLTDVGPPVAVDLDGDGRLDVITSDAFSIWAVNSAGVLPGFPVARIGADGFWPKLVAGDLDGDGEPEIISTQIEWESLSDPISAFAYVYSNRGVLERRISLGIMLSLNEPILADLDADGIPELIISGGDRVLAYKGDGTMLPGWPFVLPAGEAALMPLAGDLTGDGHPDVAFMAVTDFYVTSTGMGSVRLGLLYAIEGSGTVATGFPKSMTTAGESSALPAIADLDLDGRNEFITVSPRGFGYRDALFAWDFSTGPGGPIEWGQYRGGPDHKAFYELGKNLPDRAFLAVRSQGRGTISGTGISCGSDCIETYPKGTTVLLTATPFPGDAFEGWVGACAGVMSGCSVTVDRYTSVTARFSSTVAVQLAGTGTGTVSSTPTGIDCPTSCSQTYPGGSGITLVATAAPGSDFDGWSGACTGFATVCRLATDGAMQVTASFTTGRRLFVSKLGQGSGSVASTPAGIDCGSACSAIFPLDSQVVVTATADADSYVFGWEGPCISHLSNPAQCTATMDIRKIIKVRFVPRKKLTVQLQGSGSGTISSTPAGINCVAQTCTMLVKNGESIQLQAQPNPDSEFTGWGGQCTGVSPTCSVTAFNADVAVTANFALRPQLQLLQVATAGDSGIGKVTSSIGGIHCGQGFTVCSAFLATNATVTLTAVWVANGNFTGWSGSCSGTASTCQVVMDVARSVTATFASTSPPAPQTLNVTVAGDSTLGRITSSAGGINCGQGSTNCSTSLASGTMVTLTATAAAGGVFNGWAGDCTGVATTCNVTLSAARNVTATFVANNPAPVTHLLQVNIAGGGTGRVTSSTGGINCGLGSAACSASMPANSTVVLTAVVGANASLGGWSGDCGGASATCTVSMSAAKNVTATFNVNSTPPPSGGNGGASGGGGGMDRLSLLGLLLFVAILQLRKSLECRPARQPFDYSQSPFSRLGVLPTC